MAPAPGSIRLQLRRRAELGSASPSAFASRNDRRASARKGWAHPPSSTPPMADAHAYKAARKVFVKLNGVPEGDCAMPQRAIVG